MKHNEALDLHKFDRRLVNWNLKRGVISEKDLKAYEDSIEDSAGNAKSVEIQVDEEAINENLN